jgi:hypothetical protein
MVGCGLTPELSRTDLRPWASETQWYLHEAAKRARLERIVRLQCACSMQTTAKEVGLQLKRSAGRGLEGHQALRASSEELEHLGGPKMTAESDRSPALRVERLAPVRQLSKVIAWTGLFSVGRLWKRGRCQRQRAMRGASRHQISDSRDFRTCSLTPELSRTVLRPRRCDNLPHNGVAAKRSRLERIVRPRTPRLFGL